MAVSLLAFDAARPAWCASLLETLGVIVAGVTFLRTFHVTLLTAPEESLWLTKSPPMTRRPSRVRS